MNKFPELKSLALAAVVVWTGGVTLGNTCSNFVVDQITHNSFRVAWQNDEATGQAQIQFGPASSYGSIQGDSQAQFVPAGGTRYMTLTGISGGTSGLTLHFAAQSNNFSAYCAAVDHTVALPAAPAHPVYPAPPAAYTVAAPAIATGKIHVVSPDTCALEYPAGFTTTKWGGTSCTNEMSLRSAIRAAATSGVCNAQYGDLILLAAGSVNSIDGTTIPTTLTLCDAPDATKITSFVASTGTWGTPSPHGLSVGQRVILGWGYIGDSFTQASDALPLPFNAGYAYYVNSVPSSTTFTVSAASGGSTVTGFSGTDFSSLFYACFVPGTDVPNEQEIVIRTNTPDNQLSPFGTRVFTDENLNVLNPSAFAVIQIANTSVASTAAQLNWGCLAHHYRFVGIKWGYAAAGTVNEYDGPSYNQYLGTGTSNFHITFDRNWIGGNAYPERDYKFCLYCDGHYISFLNSVFDNLHFWTPSWSSTPLALTSGSVLTIPPGTVYFGNGVSDSLPLASGGTLTITNGAGVSGAAVFEATRSGFFLTVPTGVSAACAIAAQTCTVTTAASPAFATSGGFFARVPIASPTLSGGAWTLVNEMSPPLLSTISTDEEGGAALAFDKGPGPYLIQGNVFHNDPGITVYSTGSNSGYVNILNGACTTAGFPACQWLQPLGDFRFLQNLFQIDDAYRANVSNSAWNGRFYSMRQHWESKEGQRYQLIGNIFSGAFCANYSGRGFNLSLSNIGGTPTTSSDYEIAYNTLSNACQSLQIIGGFPGTAPPAEVSSQRIWLHDNVHTGINRYKYAAFNIAGAPGDNGNTLTINKGPQDVTIEHELFDINQGTSPSNNFVCNLVEGLAFRNNIFGYSNDDNLNGWWYSGCGGNPSPTGSYGSAMAPVAAPFNLIWNNNLLLGGFANSGAQTQMTSANIAAQSALWSGLPSTSFAPGNTIAARVAAIGFTGYNAGQYQLTSASPYVSGGVSHASDGLDLGPDPIQRCVQQGCVLNVRPRAVTATSVIVSFVAPNSTGCSVDVSTNGLTTFNRVNNSGGSRVQDVPITGLTPVTTYTFRVNCAVQQPVGSFTTI